MSTEQTGASTHNQSDPSRFPRDRHPDEYLKDLNPQEFMKSQEEKQPHKSLNDIKEAHQRFQLTRDEMRTVPIMAEGELLREGAIYANLRDEQPTEFTATSGIKARPGEWIAPKSMVDYRLWNRLMALQ
ncbi:hypothetical protein [Oligoflexus tunisiensis]|uniref:hypothetical protein n=1 Tax=Oligoflexus tunisiensis TaxID=708132 RepID=UPI00114CF9AA|nr:hypothetical protein [Oligoflexus tunisiensis]